MYGTPSSRVEGTPRSGVRGTPARQRPDLGSVRKAPQVDLQSEPVSGVNETYHFLKLCLLNKMHDTFDGTLKPLCLFAAEC